ncbi:MAG: hypothetical protein QXJ55_09480, partial [Candidatus Caldarchaeum sp.]
MKPYRLRVLWLLIGFVAVAATIYAMSFFGLKPTRLIEFALLALTPLAFAAVGECINEKSGQINIGIEGIFLISAVAGVFWAEVFESGLLGLLMGGVFGALIGG